MSTTTILDAYSDDCDGALIGEVEAHPEDTRAELLAKLADYRRDYLGIDWTPDHRGIRFYIHDTHWSRRTEDRMTKLNEVPLPDAELLRQINRPRPLRLRQYAPDHGRLCEQDSGRTIAYIAVDAADVMISSNPEFHRSTVEARRIVRAVNAHQDLLDALRGLLAFVYPGDDREPPPEQIQRARNALAAAEQP